MSLKTSYGVFFEGDELSPAGYLLLKRLGEGSFGVALQVMSLTDGKPYVRKIDHVGEDLLLSENIADVSNYFAHPNIPRLLTYKTDRRSPGCTSSTRNTRTTMTFDFCNGGSLASFMDKMKDLHCRYTPESGYTEDQTRIPEAFIQSFFSEVVSALFFLQQQGIVHKDVTRNNIFLHWSNPTDPIPQAVLGDLGVSERYPLLTHPHPKLSRPFKIHGLPSVLNLPPGTLAQEPTLKLEARMIEDNMVKSQIKFWYRVCGSDLRSVYDELLYLTEATGRYNSTEIGDMAVRSVNRQGKGINGYSKELIQQIVELGQIAHQVLSPSFSPTSYLKALQQLLQKVSSAANASRNAAIATAASDPNYRANACQITAPHIATIPQMWTRLEDIAFRNLRGGVQLKCAGGINEQIHLSMNAFEVRKIAQTPKGDWCVISSNNEFDELRFPHFYEPGIDDEELYDSDADEGERDYCTAV